MRPRAVGSARQALVPTASTISSPASRRPSTSAPRARRRAGQSRSPARRRTPWRRTPLRRRRSRIGASLDRLGVEHEHGVGELEVAHLRLQARLVQRAVQLQRQRAGDARVQVRRAEALAHQPREQVALLVGGLAAHQRARALAGAAQARGGLAARAPRRRARSSPPSRSSGSVRRASARYGARAGGLRQAAERRDRRSGRGRTASRRRPRGARARARAARARRGRSA